LGHFLSLGSVVKMLWGICLKTKRTRTTKNNKGYVDSRSKMMATLGKVGKSLGRQKDSHYPHKVVITQDLFRKIEASLYEGSI